jgi:quinol monooxygenase YgiN
MYIVHVLIRIKPETAEAFKAATLENARCSIQEPGLARFDVLEQQDDAERFVLVEVYHTPEDAMKHKETVHYAAWRDAVAEMMAEPRRSIKFNNLYPADAGWTA